MPKGTKKSTYLKVGLILECLKGDEEPLHIREIARRTKIHPYLVSYLLDTYLGDFIRYEFTDLEEQLGVKLNMPKFVILKDRTLTFKKLFRFLVFKKKMLGRGT